jgi:hypothetical protein
LSSPELELLRHLYCMGKDELYLLPLVAMA